MGQQFPLLTQLAGEFGRGIRVLVWVVQHRFRELKQLAQQFSWQFAFQD